MGMEVMITEAMGMEVMITERSGDGGVEVRAMDPHPIRGGKLVIQLKRYRSTIPPAPAWMSDSRDWGALRAATLVTCPRARASSADGVLPRWTIGIRRPLIWSSPALSSSVMM